MLKQTAAADLVKAIREVKKGNAYFSPVIAKRLREQTCRTGAEVETGRTAEPDLTPREAEVLQLIAEGKSNKDVANMLNLSLYTVETHRSNILEKLNLHSVPELILYAVRKGVIS